MSSNPAPLMESASKSSDSVFPGSPGDSPRVPRAMESRAPPHSLLPGHCVDCRLAARGLVSGVPGGTCCGAAVPPHRHLMLWVPPSFHPRPHCRSYVTSVLKGASLTVSPGTLPMLVPLSGMLLPLVHIACKALSWLRCPLIKDVFLDPSLPRWYPWYPVEAFVFNLSISPPG